MKAHILRKVDQKIQALRDMGYEINIQYVPELDQEIAEISLMGEAIAVAAVDFRGELSLITLQEDGVEATELLQKFKMLK